MPFLLGFSNLIKTSKTRFSINVSFNRPVKLFPRANNSVKHHRYYVSNNNNCRCKDRDIEIPSKSLKKNDLLQTKEGVNGDLASNSFANSTSSEQNRSKLNQLSFECVRKCLWPTNAKMRLRVMTTFGILIISKIVNVSVPIFFKSIIDAMNELDSVHAMVIIPIGVIVSYSLVRSIASFFHEIRSLVFVPITQQAIRDVATETFLHLLKMDLMWHLSRQTGAVSRAVERGTRAIQQILNSVLFNLFPTILEIGLVCALLGARFGLQFVNLIIGLMAVYFFVTIYITKWRTKFRIEMNRLDNEAASVSMDSLINFETVKYFNNENHEVHRYGHLLAEYDKSQRKIVFSLALLNWVQNLIFSVSLALGMTMAAQGVISGQMTVGDIVMVNALLLQLSIPLNFLGSIYRETKQAVLDMSAFMFLRNFKPKIVDKPTAVPLSLTGGEIVFENVVFQLNEDKPILKNVSFTIPAKKKVALVGHSGSGKSSIVRLIYRLFEPTAGRILIDGTDICDVTIDSLRDSIGVVPQDLVLFNESILYNIKYSKLDATDEEVMEAAKLANIYDAIMKMPKKFDTIVGERGLILSGGERQRICIARSLLSKPPIMILDEATSSLDTESEAAVIKAVDNIVNSGCTILIISHRIKSVVSADKILFLKDGRIVESGTHDELVEESTGHYRSLVDIQNLPVVKSVR